MAATLETGYDRMKELKAFDETKAGVKSIVDSGATEIPRIFRTPPEQVNDYPIGTHKFKFPVIDISGVNNPESRKEIVEKIRKAASEWGFFEVLNHGIPVNILDEMLAGVKGFFENDPEEKKAFYTRDLTKKVVHNVNFDYYRVKTTNWRDSFYVQTAPDPPTPEELPSSCRDILMEYTKQVDNLGNILFEILSEALGLHKNQLKEMGCTEGHFLVCHYYPPCPQPELTLGTSKHQDSDFLTILLQDEIGGLQILHQNHWVDVIPTRGGIVVNIGDLMQIITNDKFISVEHRVMPKRIGPRISSALFYSSNFTPIQRKFGPIKELLSKDEPPRYRATTIKEYTEHYTTKGLNGISSLEHFRI